MLGTLIGLIRIWDVPERYKRYSLCHFNFHVAQRQIISKSTLAYWTFCSAAKLLLFIIAGRVKEYDIAQARSWGVSELK